MIRKILLPPMQDHRFVTYDDVIKDTRYNQHQFDREWYMLLIREWQDYSYYAQKRQFSDRCSLQISAPPGSTVKLQLYKCDGTMFDEYDMLPLLSADGTELPVYNKGRLYSAYDFFEPLFWSNPDLTEGRYCFVIQITKGSDVDKVISEPIDLAEFHDGTILFEWTNRENKSLCMFEPNKKKFSLRVEGDVLDLDTLVDREVFTDHEYNTTELKATAYRGWKGYVGNYPSGVPEYLLDMINYGWALSSKRIEGKAFTAAEGAKWQKEASEGNTLFTSSMDLREQNIQDAYTIVKGSFTVIPVTPYPWVNMFVSVGKDNIDDFYYNPGKPTYVTNDAGRDAFVDLLNDAVIASGLDGMFDVVAGNIDYILGINETYDQSNAPILTKFVALNSITTGSSQNLNTYVGMASPATGGSSAYAFITPSGVQQGEYFSGTGIYPIYSPFVAGAAGTYTQYLFHDDTLDRLELSGDYLRNFTDSKFPSNLKTLVISNNPRLTAFTIFNTLMHCAQSLQILVMHNNHVLASVTAFSDYTIGTLFGNTMTKLQNIDLRDNAMVSLGLNALYNSMKNAMQQLPSQFTVFNGFIDTGGQVGGGQPTNFPASGNSSTARSMLQNTYHWTVIIA